MTKKRPSILEFGYSKGTVSSDLTRRLPSSLPRYF